MQHSFLTNQMIHEKLKSLCRSERAITAEILVFIGEVSRRELYLEMGYDSLLTYLIKEMGYSKTAALRRKDAAKLLSEIPDLKKDFSKGSLNLTQASVLAQGVRQKLAEHKKESQTPATSSQVDFFQPEPLPTAPRKPVISTEQKKQIVSQLRNQTLESSQKTVAQALDLKAKADEKRRLQKDNSVRAEMTFNEEQMKDLERVQQLLSHVHPSGKLSDIIAYMAKEF